MLKDLDPKTVMVYAEGFRARSYLIPVERTTPTQVVTPRGRFRVAGDLSGDKVKILAIGDAVHSSYSCFLVSGDELKRIRQEEKTFDLIESLEDRFNHLVEMVDGELKAHSRPKGFGYHSPKMSSKLCTPEQLVSLIDSLQSQMEKLGWDCTMPEDV